MDINSITQEELNLFYIMTSESNLHSLSNWKRHALKCERESRLIESLACSYEDLPLYIDVEYEYEKKCIEWRLMIGK